MSLLHTALLLYYCFTTASLHTPVFASSFSCDVCLRWTLSLLLLYYCFTESSVALLSRLLLYYCFTESSVALLSRLLLYYCVTTSLFPLLGLAAFMPMHLWPIFTHLIYSYDNWCATNAGAQTSCQSISSRLKTLVAQGLIH